ncbi:MAG: di-heme oxidoredictase family protein [Thermoanaerobaculia bacterium]
MHRTRLVCAVLIFITLGAPWLYGKIIGDGPVLLAHVDQQKIDAGELSFQEIFDSGKFLFSAKFNTFDGQGRPGTRGDGMPRVSGSAPRFIRTSGPDANSCAGCHNDPFPGAAGDIVANVFVLSQALDPVNPSVSGDFSNERNTLGMHGSGVIEMLAREMSSELIAARTAALTEAARTGAAVTKPLLAKGVSFGSITASPGGIVDTSGVSGVNPDLIIRPFHQKGVVRSLREFSNNAFNHHHGLQSAERFGAGDPDGDGLSNELTAGDITAATIWQAALNTPGQVIPNDGQVARAIIRGERTFSLIGCASCHVPELELSSTAFSEPNPFNVAGNLRIEDVPKPFRFDLTKDGPLPRPEKTPDGRVIVRAYTDLKRHDLCDAELQHFCDEKIVQAGVPTRQFLTRKLWDAGNTAPYGHHGDLTTLTEAIHEHGGEGRVSRDAFFALHPPARADVIEFLKSLQILPEGTPALVVDDKYRPLDKETLAASVGAIAPDQLQRH